MAGIGYHVLQVTSSQPSSIAAYFELAGEDVVLTMGSYSDPYERVLTLGSSLKVKGRTTVTTKHLLMSWFSFL